MPVLEGQLSLMSNDSIGDNQDPYLCRGNATPNFLFHQTTWLLLSILIQSKTLFPSSHIISTSLLDGVVRVL